MVGWDPEMPRKTASQKTKSWRRFWPDMPIENMFRRACMPACRRTNLVFAKFYRIASVTSLLGRPRYVKRTGTTSLDGTPAGTLTLIWPCPPK